MMEQKTLDQARADFEAWQKDPDDTHWEVPVEYVGALLARVEELELLFGGHVTTTALRVAAKAPSSVGLDGTEGAWKVYEAACACAERARLAGPNSTGNEAFGGEA